MSYEFEKEARKIFKIAGRMIAFSEKQKVNRAGSLHPTFMDTEQSSGAGGTHFSQPRGRLLSDETLKLAKREKSE